jgi:hypothetical protein
MGPGIFWREGEQTEASLDLRGTIVIEHIIQASDIAHTVQQWHAVYQKWNKTCPQGSVRSLVPGVIVVQ